MILYIKAFRQAGCRPGRKKKLTALANDPAMHHTSITGKAFRKLYGLGYDTGGIRIAGTMAILLLVALVSLQATPMITAKAQQLLAGADAVVPVSMSSQQPPDSLPSKQSEYLSKAREALRKLRYTKPSHDNAYYYYRLVLDESPDNEEALQGIAKIAEIHADLVEWALGLHEYSKAREYLVTGMKIDPRNQRLATLAANDVLR
jgi:hypothetical protein